MARPGVVEAMGAATLSIALAIGCAPPAGPAPSPAAPERSAPEPVRSVPTVAAATVERGTPPGLPSATAEPVPAAATGAGFGGGGSGISCMGLVGDASPPACPDATFCHRIALADLTLSVAAASPNAPPKEEIVGRFLSETRWQLFDADGGALTACFRSEPRDRALRASVQVELTSKWGQCPSKPSRILKSTATKATAECVRDALDRVMLPGEESRGRARLVLEVSLSGLEP